MRERIGIRRFTGDFAERCPAAAVVSLLNELGPDGGDFVVVRAAPLRAEAIERNLVAQLIPEGW